MSDKLIRVSQLSLKVHGLIETSDKCNMELIRHVHLLIVMHLYSDRYMDLKSPDENHCSYFSTKIYL